MSPGTDLRASGPAMMSTAFSLKSLLFKRSAMHPMMPSTGLFSVAGLQHRTLGVSVRAKGKKRKGVLHKILRSQAR